MSTVLCNACMLLLPLSVAGGAVMALPIWLPPLRALTWRGEGARRAVVWFFVALAFVVSFTLWARSYAELTYSMATEVYVESDCWREQCLRHYGDIVNNRAAIAEELRVRYLVPPPLRNACYTGDARVCSLADETYWGAYSQHVTSARPWLEYLGQGALSMLSAAGAFLMGQRLTSRKYRPEPLPPLSSVLKSKLQNG